MGNTDDEILDACAIRNIDAATARFNETLDSAKSTMTADQYEQFRELTASMIEGAPDIHAMADFACVARMVTMHKNGTGHFAKSAAPQVAKPARVVVQTLTADDKETLRPWLPDGSKTRSNGRDWAEVLNQRMQAHFSRYALSTLDEAAYKSWCTAAQLGIWGGLKAAIDSGIVPITDAAKLNLIRALCAEGSALGEKITARKKQRGLPTLIETQKAMPARRKKSDSKSVRAR